MEQRQDIENDEEIVVRFRANDGGRAHATWGQTLICDDIASYGSGSGHFNIAGAIHLDSPIGVAALLDALETVTLRHESLRTNFEESRTGWRQIVRDTGAFTVRVVTVSKETEDWEGALEALIKDLNSAPYELLESHPVRFGAVVKNQSVIAVGYSICHSAIDGYGARLFRAALVEAIRGTLRVKEASGTGFRSPREESAFQASDEGRAVHDRAMLHWKAALEQLPAKAADVPGEEFYDLRLTSNRLVENALRIALARKTTSANVFLAAAARASSVVLREPLFSAQVTVNNRFRSGVKELIAPVSMEGIILIDASNGSGFDHLLSRASLASLRCYQASYFDKRAMLEVAKGIERARGLEIDVSRWYNDEHSSEGDFSTKRERNMPTLVSQPSPNKPVDVTYAMGIRGDIALTTIVLTANTCVFPQEDMQAFLLEMDGTLAVEAART